MTQERKDGEERRYAPRYPVNIDVEWEGAIGRQQGTISDISRLGCHVLCSGEVDDGEQVNIFIPLGDGMKIQFLAEVRNHVYEIGFGVQFKDMNDAQKQFIESLIEAVEDGDS